MLCSIHFILYRKPKISIIVTRNSSPSQVNWYYFEENVLGLLKWQSGGPGLPCSPRQRGGSGSGSAWWRRGGRPSGELSPRCREPRPAASAHGPGGCWGPPGTRWGCAGGRNWNVKTNISDDPHTTSGSGSLGNDWGRALSDDNEQPVVWVDSSLQLELVQLEVDQSPEVSILVTVGDNNPHPVLHGFLDNAGNKI